MDLKRTLRHGVALLALGMLGACSNGKFATNPAIDYLIEYAGYGGEEAAQAPAKPATRAPLVVGYEDIRVAIPFDRMRGDTQQYAAPDGATLWTRNGFVTRSSGIEAQVEGIYFSAESPYVGDFVAAARRGERTERIHEYFKEGRLRRDTYRCVLTSSRNDAGREVIDELCKRFFDEFVFNNRYWVNDTGRVECSLQWVHPDSDFLQIFATEQQAVTLDLRRQGC